MRWVAAVFALEVSCAFSTVTYSRAEQESPVPRQAITGDELQAVLALAQQAQVANVGCLAARFKLTYYAIPSDSASRVASAPARPLIGVFHCLRDGAIERVDARFENALDEQRQHGFINQTIVDDGDKQTTYWVDTKHALVTRSGPIPLVVMPWDVFGAGSRRDFGRLLAQGAVFSAAAGDDGNVHLEYTFPLTEIPTGVRVEAELAVDLDYAVTHWHCPAWGQTVDIEYDRTSDGLLYPKRAVMTYGAGEGCNCLFERVVAETEELTYDRPALESMKIRFEPGTGIRDTHTRGSNGKARIFVVGADGIPTLGAAVPSPVHMPLRTKVGVFVGAAVLTVGGALVRLRSGFVSDHGNRE